jgi:hypothetical protein
MPKCLKCNKAEVAPDELYYASCKAPAEKDKLRISRNTWAVLGAFIPFGSIAGCYCWAKYKNRSKWFMLLGIVWWIGYIVMAILKDKSTILESEKK